MTLLDTLNQQHCSISSIEEMLLQRHYQTYRHCERMVPLADAFAEACDLHGQARDILLYSALFHDIGKIGIPDEILMFEGQLDMQQRAVMELHSAIGETIVQRMGLDDSEEIAAHVRHHHEHYGGSGYPDGLKGKQIPLIARMLTILDTYDALREMRPYRNALSHEQTVGIMQQESGKVHDPKLLERFLGIDNLESINEKYPEK